MTNDARDDRSLPAKQILPLFPEIAFARRGGIILAAYDPLFGSYGKKKGNVKNVFIPYSLKVYRCIRHRGDKETGFSFNFFLNFCLK